MISRQALFGVCGFLAAALPLSAAAAAAAATDPLALYGEDIAFDVYRDGEKVGFHRVHFAREGAELSVESRFQVEVDVLFLTAYRFDYHSEGRWREGVLEGLTAAVDDDGEAASLEARREGDGYRIESSEAGSVFAAMPLFPTTHWNAAVLDQGRVLNTLTGKVNAVRIRARGRESVTSERGAIEATRYDYTGELETTAWYDDEGRWVKLRFEARDGSIIDYACRRCQGPAQQAEAPRP